MAQKKKEVMEEQVVPAPIENGLPIEEVVGETTEEVVEDAEDETPIARSRSFIMAKYPDKTYDDEAMYEEDLANYLEQSDKDLQAYRDADVQLEEILDLNPELALIIGDLKRGVPFATALARYVDIEDLAPIEGEEDYEDYEKSKADRKAELQSKKEREDMLRTNAEKSAEEILDYLENKGWDEARRADFDSWFEALVARLSENLLGKKEMDIFVKAYEHDGAVERAEEKGRIKGRNEKIETKRKLQENVDELPEGGTTSKESKSGPRQRQVFDIGRLLNK